jgi:3-oxoacyl-[acyl-carrier protein] reductase
VHKLKGKTAIVTGASRGIGWAIANKLAHEGANVVLCARDTKQLQFNVEQLQQEGLSASSIALDLRLTEAPAKLVEFSLEKFSQVDIVVNNAGATKRGDFTELTDDDWLDGFALKFFGAVRLTRAAWPHLAKTSGSVVNIAGIGGRTPGTQFTIGGSVNAAMLSFTKAMSETGIACQIQVNAINPGAIQTDRFQKRLYVEAKEKGINLAEAERRFIANEKVMRIGEPNDIANLVAFVVSPEGRFLQGALIDMDGGATKTI